MNFEHTDAQVMIQETFARYLDRESSTARVRAAMPDGGFDRALWQGLAKLGAFAMRVPAARGGLDLGLFEATILMEECGRTLASGPVAEALVAARVLARLGADTTGPLLEDVLDGRSVLAIAFADLARSPVQIVAGGLCADFVIARHHDAIVLVAVPEEARRAEPNLAATPIAELELGVMPHQVLASGKAAVEVFDQAIEEWKLLMSAALSGLSREAIRHAAAYAAEREQFGQPIGAFQGISHPLADRITEIEGGKYFLWKTLRDAADGALHAGAEISLAAWWHIQIAGRSCYQAVHTFGGYGLTSEYDIHLYNLRAKAWPLTFGDPAGLLEEAGRRLYAAGAASIPDIGELLIEFGYDEEANAFAAELDAFFDRHLTPEIRTSPHVVENEHDPDIYRKLAEANLLFPAWPQERGGRGATALAIHAARDVYGRRDWKNGPVSVSTMVARIIDQFGSDEVKRDIFPRLLRGDAVCALGFSEPGAGSDVFAAQCRSTRDGEGWRIDGTKMFTSRANISDYVLLLTRSDPTGRKHEGLTMFIVPLKVPGVEIQPIYTFMDERTNVTFYDNVQVPDAYRLGEAGRGVQVMAASLTLEHSGASYHHDQKRTLEAAEEICRTTFRNDGLLIASPSAQTRLARSFAHIEITRMLALRALWCGMNKKPDQALGAMVKLFSSESFRIDSADLLELTAPHSLLKGSGARELVNLGYRLAHGTTVYGGTSEIHRSVIAERNLKLPRSRM